MTVVFQHNVYVSVLETAGENPLLDSRFPDISGKGRGYQLQACNDGVPDWPQLRKVSIWQTVGALEQVAATPVYDANLPLQRLYCVCVSRCPAQEFKEKAAEFAQAKSRIEMKIKKIGVPHGSGDSGDDEAAAEDSGPDRGDDHSAKGAEDKESKPAAADSPETTGVSAAAEEKRSPVSSPGKAMMMITNSAHSPSATSGDHKKTYASVTSSPGRSSSGLATGAPSEPLRPLGNVRLGALGGGGGGSAHQSLPHHVPKMDALSKKMDEIRRTMGEEVRANWSTLSAAHFV